MGNQAVLVYAGLQPALRRLLHGQVLGPGSTVAGCIYLAHRRKAVYADPEQFRPDRFLGQHYSAFEFLPFGGGIRRCLGMAFPSLR